MVPKIPLFTKADEDKREETIITRCLSGDQRAYRQLYDLYAKSLFNTGLRILNNVAETEDIIQESFVDAFKNISGFENRSSFSTWLKRIVIHKCINLVKKRKLAVTELTETLIENIPSEIPEEDENIQWEINKVVKSIGLLPDPYRLVVTLYLLEGYDHEEIAGILGLPKATVRTQYVRGKQKLISIIKNN